MVAKECASHFPALLHFYSSGHTYALVHRKTLNLISGILFILLFALWCKVRRTQEQLPEGVLHQDLLWKTKCDIEHPIADNAAGTDMDSQHKTRTEKRQ